MVRVECLMLHKGDANNVLPTAIAYRCVPRYGYCVSCTVPCGVYRCAPLYRSGPSSFLVIVINTCSTLFLWEYLRRLPLNHMQCGATSRHSCDVILALLLFSPTLYSSHLHFLDFKLQCPSTLMLVFLVSCYKDGNFYEPYRLKAKTKTNTGYVRHGVYADGVRTESPRTQSPE